MGAASIEPVPEPLADRSVLEDDGEGGVAFSLSAEEVETEVMDAFSWEICDGDKAARRGMMMMDV